MAFVKGQSGNPEGRKKEDFNLKVMARAHTEAALATLVKALGAGSERTRVAAAAELLDRGWGKPAQFVENQHSGAIVQKVISGDPLTLADWSAKYETPEETAH